MMNKKDKTELLFSGIGEIDDNLLNEAVTYKSNRRKNYNFGMLAACFALIFVVAIAFPLLDRAKNMSDHMELDTEADASEVYYSLDNLLADSHGGKYQKLDSFDTLSYFGDAGLVWQNVDSGDIYFTSLTAYQLEEVTENLGRGEHVGEESPEISCKIWILDGEGNVMSPYLKSGSGNLDCAIFDYEVEIIPDDSFVECVSDILH